MRHFPWIVVTFGFQTYDLLIQYELTGNAHIGDIFSRIDVFRINMSHEHDHALVVKKVAHIRKSFPHAKILIDLQGPKIRTCPFPHKMRDDGVTGQVFTTGQKVRMRAGQHDTSVGSEQLIYVDAPALITSTDVGDKVFFDDGLLEAVITAKNSDEIEVEFTHGGLLLAYKGANTNSSQLELEVLTTKDKRDMQVAAEVKADWVACSFVGTAHDVTIVRSEIAKYPGFNPEVCVKFEREKALAELTPIAQACDVLMLARGDLWVELGSVRLASEQDRIIDACVVVGTPVIWATQLVKNMVTEPMPSRAEGTDVLHAIRKWARYLMLSGETTFGKYPLESIKFLADMVDAYGTKR